MSQTRYKWMGAIRAMINQAKTAGKDKATYIGQDNVGNKYYEAFRPNNPRKQIQRYFLRDDVTESTLAVDVAKVPPAWDAWLRFRRPAPPTEEELRESDEYFENQQAMALERKAKEVAEKEKDKESENLNSTTKRTQPRERQQSKKMPAKRENPQIPSQP